MKFHEKDEAHHPVVYEGCESNKFFAYFVVIFLMSARVPVSGVKIATRVSLLSISEGAVMSGYSCSMLMCFQTCVSTGFGSICVGMLAEGLIMTPLVVPVM